MERNILFNTGSFSDYTVWGLTDKKIFERLSQMIEQCRRTPFEGIGKPEPLKHQKHGFWSRRIDDKNRFVYKVEQDKIIIESCKGHY